MWLSSRRRRDLPGYAASNWFDGDAEKSLEQLIKKDDDRVTLFFINGSASGLLPAAPSGRSIASLWKTAAIERLFLKEHLQIGSCLPACPDFFGDKGGICRGMLRVTSLMEIIK